MGRANIGVNEVVALEQQRLAQGFGERVGETIANVEPGGMATSAEPAKSVDRDLRLLRRDRRNLDWKIPEQPLEIGPARFAISAFNDERQFDSRNG